MNFPKSIENLITEFMKYPGVGRKTAERFVFHTINKLDKEEVKTMVQAFIDLKDNIKHCQVCHNLTDDDVCHICKDEHRDSSIILVVENAKDVFSIEETSQYKGLYHVLNGVLSPADGIGPDDLFLKDLWDRVSKDKVKEIIIATSSTQEGETTALYIKRVLENTDLIISRIGYGVPVGLNLEYADQLTLSKAIENRKKI
ncbi:recombination protein RecR [Hujiaoplasma nucleasis]|uniref:Recombination protein RecR n=1 Tax=Hujiaoplasma nucleasis TaxID=2725268 RepID=A0A7L6N5Z9_9MOLU|nr:recombination mediator RecR [Hujiaoplasma nucleasis]QLY40425.1 recombination protein RecR [Hujiaoplasma nucleasis]